MLRPTKVDKRLVRELKSLASPEDPYETVSGKTMCTNDFYEGQGRLDGAFCEYAEAEKMEYLHKLSDFGEADYPCYLIIHDAQRRLPFQASSISRWSARRSGR